MKKSITEMKSSLVALFEGFYLKFVGHRSTLSMDCFQHRDARFRWRFASVGLMALLLLLNGGGVQLQAQECIQLSTQKKVGETIKLKIKAKGTFSIEGVKEPAQVSNSKVQYTLSSSTVTIKGAVTELVCSSSQLEKLDVTKASSLTYLDCSINQLKVLDLLNTPHLTYLDVADNKISSLKVEHLTELKTFDCGHNELTSLAPKSPLLEEFSCQDNFIASLDLSACPKVSIVICQVNRLDRVGMKNFVASLPNRPDEDGLLYVIDTQKTDEQNVCTRTDVATLSGKGWTVYDYNGTHEREYPGSEEGGDTPKQTLSFTTDKPVGSKISFVCNGSSDLKATGVEGVFTPSESVVEYTLTHQTVTIAGSSITKFVSTYSEITMLDVSKAADLEWLDVSNNKLSDLDLTALSRLKILGCGVNALSELDVSASEVLEGLNCNRNQLTKLSLSNNLENLSYLNCSGNKILLIDAQHMPALQTLVCFSNKLTHLYFSERNAKLETLQCFDNELRRIETQKLPRLRKLYCGTNFLSQLELSHNPLLEELWCGGNELTLLDLSHNPAMFELLCAFNRLSSLVVSPQATGMITIDCYVNQMNADAMAKLVESLPQVQSSDDCLFNVVDTQEKEERNRCTKEQVKKVLAKGWKAMDFNGGNLKPYDGEWSSCERWAERAIRVYPSSFDSYLAVQNKPLESSVYLYDREGRLIKEWSSCTQEILDTQELPQGQYIIKIDNYSQLIEKR